MERPVLRLHRGGQSPILMEWFTIEAPKPQDFEGEGADGEESETRRNSHLRLNLKRLQKEVDGEGRDESMEGSGCRLVTEKEVEYMD